MKITILSPFSDKSAGMKRLYQLAKGMDVTFILPKEDKYGVSQDDPLFYFPIEKKSFLALPIYTARALLHLIFRDPEVVYFYKPHPFTFLPAFIYKLLHPDCITIFDCDEWEPATLKDNDEPYYKQLLMLMTSKFCIWFSDKIVYTNYNLTLEGKIPVDKWHRSFYIPNGVDTEKFKPTRRKKHEGFNIFVVSYLHKIKHILPIIDTVSIAKSKIPNFKCNIIGDGPRREELQSILLARGLKRYFKFMGVIPYTELPNVLSNADVIVIPYSNLEGMHYQCNIKIFEFMALGIPIIASDVGEISKYLEYGEAGYVVEPDKPEELAEAVISVYNNRKEAMKKARCARKVSMEKNDWKFRTEKLEWVINRRILERQFTQDEEVAGLLMVLRDGWRTILELALSPIYMLEAILLKRGPLYFKEGDEK